MSEAGDTTRQWHDGLVKALASFFYLGYLPLAPGTMGALGGLVLYILLYLISPVYFRLPLKVGFLIFLVIFFLIGVYAAGRGERIWQKRDSPLIVIDEAFSIFITLFLIPFAGEALVGGFILNRFFDVCKPFPSSYLEALPGGWGVMLDDVVAGVYSNLFLRIILLLTG